MKWYAAYTKPAKEAMVAELLGQADIETYIPKLKQKKYRRKQYRDVIEPMFPSYIFAKFDPPTQLWTVRYTRGVRKVVGNAEAPWAVSEEMIEFFRARETDGVIMAAETDLKAGDAVRIADGPFAGLRAVLLRPMKGTERALLLLQAIEYQAQVLVDGASLRKLD